MLFTLPMYACCAVLEDDGSVGFSWLSGTKRSVPGEVLAVAANGDGALQVGAVDVHLCVPQMLRVSSWGVAVLVACAAGDDAHFRQNSVQKQVSGAGAGAVVPYLQHIGFQLAPLFTRSVSAVFSMSPVSRKLVLPRWSMRSTSEVLLSRCTRSPGLQGLTVALPSGQTVPTEGTSSCKPCCWCI